MWATLPPEAGAGEAAKAIDEGELWAMWQCGQFQPEAEPAPNDENLRCDSCGLGVGSPEGAFECECGARVHIRNCSVVCDRCGVRRCDNYYCRRDHRCDRREGSGPHATVPLLLAQSGARGPRDAAAAIPPSIGEAAEAGADDAGGSAAPGPEPLLLGCAAPGPGTGAYYLVSGVPGVHTEQFMQMLMDEKGWTVRVVGKPRQLQAGSEVTVESRQTCPRHMGIINLRFGPLQVSDEFVELRSRSRLRAEAAGAAAARKWLHTQVVEESKEDALVTGWHAVM